LPLGLTTPDLIDMFLIAVKISVVKQVQNRQYWFTDTLRGGLFQVFE